MTNTTINNFRKNVIGYVNQAITYNIPVNIATDAGNAVVISEEEYNGMLATLELMREPGLVESILEASNAQDSEFTQMSDMEWE
ncbi:MAG: type II toxin-antitoxin system Phd/YefM family antitoxin [Clostridia bacterium]|nr:type II toxin-antitoxin system Phd/YefM family antitoxin [Clostridia bacterium]